MITKPKDVLAQKRIEFKKKHMPYTSLGERQTMQVLHNLGHTNKQIASALGCNKRTVIRVLDVFKKTNWLVCTKKKSGRPRKMNKKREQELLHGGSNW